MINKKTFEEKKKFYYNGHLESTRKLSSMEYKSSNDYVYLPLMYDLLDLLKNVTEDNISDSLMELQIELEKELLMRAEYRVKGIIRKLIEIENIKRKIHILSDLKNK